jgi:hypothetical protein
MEFCQEIFDERKIGICLRGGSGHRVMRSLVQNIPGIYTLFLPDRILPVYFLILIGYASMIFIYGGIRMIIFLIELF